MGSSAQDLSARNKGSRRGKHRTASIVDYNAIQSQLLLEAIRVIARSGGALRFGLTRDQGAYALGIYGEGDPYTEYMHSPEDFSELLRELIRDYGEGDATGSKLGL